jgi:hypothetical protein
MTTTPEQTADLLKRYRDDAKRLRDIEDAKIALQTAKQSGNKKVEKFIIEHLSKLEGK